MDDVPPVARELRRAREALGMSREQLAEKMNVSASLIAKVERGRVKPTRAFIDGATTVLTDGIDRVGLFARLREDEMRAAVIGHWRRDWFAIEDEATTIRQFEPLVIPGLLQTEAYARALTGSDVALAARMERQPLLLRDDAPEVFVVISEAALHRGVGGPGVMEEQLKALAEAPATVQVLPADAETYAGCDGSFVLASIGNRHYVYVDTPARGFLMEDGEVVSRVQRTWEELRAHALSPRQSREVILRAAESWKTNSG